MPRSRRERRPKEVTSDTPATGSLDWLRGAWVPWTFAMVSLAGASLALGHRALLAELALPSGGPLGFRSARALLTYSFAPRSFGSWAVPVVYILLASYLLRRETSDGKQIVLAIAAAVSGGITYEVLTPAGRLFAGGSVVAWGFNGAAATYGLIRWRSLSWPWRVYVVYVGFVVLVRALDLSSPQSSLSAAALVGALLSASWTWKPRSSPAGIAGTGERA